MDVNKLQEIVLEQNPPAKFILETVKHQRYQATVLVDGVKTIVQFKVPLDKKIKNMVPSSKIIKYLSFD